MGQRERPTGTLGTSWLQTTGSWSVFKQVGALKEGTTIVFADQSGFYLLAGVVRTLTLRWDRHPSSRSISAAITSQQ
jgi:hypothetical protein